MMALWKVLFLKTAVKILIFYFMKQQIAERSGVPDTGMPQAGLSSAKGPWSVPPWLVALVCPSPEAAMRKLREKSP